MINNNLLKFAFIIPFFASVLLSGPANGTPKDNFISTNAHINFDATTIQEIIDDYSYINYSKDYLQPLSSNTTQFTTIELVNPLGITTGCGTVEANFDETLTILLNAFSQTLEVMPAFLIKNSLGFPDISNPKAVFEFIYDTTTTVICGAESGAEATVEWAFNEPWEHLSNLFSTTSDEESKLTDADQINHLCAQAAEKDEHTSQINAGENKSADDQTESTGIVELTVDMNEAMNKCKAKYDGYKSFINGKIKEVKLLEQKNKKTLKSSCDVLQNERLKDASKPKSDQMGYSKVIEINPIYISELQPHKIEADFNGIKSVVVLQKDSSVDSETIINREDQKDSADVYIPVMPTKTSIVSSMAPNVFKLASEYQRLLDICTSPKLFQESRLKLSDADKLSFDLSDAQLRAYKDTCPMINSKDSPFPIQLSDPDKPTLDFTKRLLNKKSLCDLTWFNIDNDQFIIDSIGYATMALDKTRFILNPDNYTQITSPTLPELRAATRDVILEDFCQKKLVNDIDQLEDAFIKNIDTDKILTSRDADGIFLKAQPWRDNEVYVPPYLQLPTLLSTGSNPPTISNKIVKICEKSPLQTEYFVATVDDSNPAVTNIVKITASNIRDLVDELGFDDFESTPIESLFPTKYETELICDKKAGESSCPANKPLACGINWNKSTSREDTLFENPKSTNKDKSGASDKIGDFAAYVKRKFDMDKKSAPSQLDFERNLILKGRRQQTTEVINKFNNTLINHYLFIDLREIEYQNRLNNLRF